MTSSEAVDGATHAERTTLEHATMIQETPFKVLHDTRDLNAAQDDRYAKRHARARHALNTADLDVEDVAIQEQKRAQRLVLR